MKPLYDLADRYVNGTAKTRIYGLFIMWMIILHINLIYFAMFVDEKLIFEAHGLLKNEYILSHYVAIDNIWFWIGESAKTLLAGALSYAMIWILPELITHRAFNKEYEDDYKLKYKKIEIDHRLERNKEKLIEAKLDNVTKESTVLNKQEELIRNEEDIWSDEYLSFKKTSLFNHFGDIRDSIYEYYGKIEDSDYNGHTTWQLHKSVLAYANSNDLVDLDGGNITLTQKGKYFIKRYQLDHS